MKSILLNSIFIIALGFIHQSKAEDYLPPKNYIITQYGIEEYNKLNKDDVNSEKIYHRLIESSSYRPAGVYNDTIAFRKEKGLSAIYYKVDNSTISNSKYFRDFKPANFRLDKSLSEKYGKPILLLINVENDLCYLYIKNIAREKCEKNSGLTKYYSTDSLAIAKRILESEFNETYRNNEVPIEIEKKFDKGIFYQTYRSLLFRNLQEFQIIEKYIDGARSRFKHLNIGALNEKIYGNSYNYFKDYNNFLYQLIIDYYTFNFYRYFPNCKEGYYIKEISNSLPKVVEVDDYGNKSTLINSIKFNDEFKVPKRLADLCEIYCGDTTSEQRGIWRKNSEKVDRLLEELESFMRNNDCKNEAVNLFENSLKEFHEIYTYDLINKHKDNLYYSVYNSINREGSETNVRNVIDYTSIENPKVAKEINFSDQLLFILMASSDKNILRNEDTIKIFQSRRKYEDETIDPIGGRFFKVPTPRKIDKKVIEKGTEKIKIWAKEVRELMKNSKINLKIELIHFDGIFKTKNNRIIFHSPQDFKERIRDSNLIKIKKDWVRDCNYENTINDEKLMQCEIIQSELTKEMENFKTLKNNNCGQENICKEYSKNGKVSIDVCIKEKCNEFMDSDIKKWKECVKIISIQQVNSKLDEKKPKNEIEKKLLENMKDIGLCGIAEEKIRQHQDKYTNLDCNNLTHSRKKKSCEDRYIQDPIYTPKYRKVSSITFKGFLSSLNHSTIKDLQLTPQHPIEIPYSNKNIKNNNILLQLELKDISVSINEGLLESTISNHQVLSSL